MEDKDIRRLARHLIRLQPPTRTKVIGAFPYDDKVRLIQEVKVLESDKPSNKRESCDPLVRWATSTKP